LVRSFVQKNLVRSRKGCRSPVWTSLLMRFRITYFRSFPHQNIIPPSSQGITSKQQKNKLRTTTLSTNRQKFENRINRVLEVESQLVEINKIRKFNCKNFIFLIWYFRINNFLLKGTVIKCNFKWPFMQKYPIHNGTLKSFICLSMN